MRVLGIDPGSETLGWGVIKTDGRAYRLLQYGTVKTSPREPFATRLLRIGEGVEEIIERFEPDALSLEEAFYAANVKVALKLGQVRGVVMYVATKHKLEIGEYAPRLIKQTVVGYGNAEKHQVQEMMRILLKLPHVPERNLSFSSRRIKTTPACCTSQNQNPALIKKKVFTVLSLIFVRGKRVRASP
jgi:crossover junction endodeoxyribonuclease RuvC